MGRVHFVGIGGTGLSAIARVLLEQGEQVSGSDLQASALTAGLARQGAVVLIGHRAENVHGADVVVVSSAVHADNPEVEEARRRGIPVMKRAEFLGRLLAGRRVIAVAGTHGKTTTTAMIAWMLTSAGLEPGFIVGGEMVNLGTNARAGKSGYFVIEADEYDRMFWGLTPWLAVVTNIELDHVDCYPTLKEAREAYAVFLSRTLKDGAWLICSESRMAMEAALTAAQQYPQERPALFTYGWGAADWRAELAGTSPAGGRRFWAHWQGQAFGPVELRVPGDHNVLNALAAVAVGRHLGLGIGHISAALESYVGVGRRFEVKGEAGGVTVVDDYAHHPTEIRATLGAARQRFPGRRIWAVFQPHTYSRTKALLAEFAHSFGDADGVIVTDIYAAREMDDGSVHASQLVEAMEGGKARYIGALDEARRYLLEHVKPGDVVITLGAGDGCRVGEELLAVLRAREAGHGQS
ncbi:MAG: UDP-N-acetylmuramate--L-alanine ligase [Anaerolineae bacterium]